MKNAIVMILLSMTFGMDAAVAQNAVLDHQGYMWETGHFPPSNSGDVLNLVGVIDAIDGRFSIDLNSTEVSVWASNLVSQGQANQGGGILAVPYSGGDIEVWVDNSRNHAYGVNPPNATAPSTFRNGNLLLGGTLSNFFLYFDTTTGSGAYEADVDFTTGSGLAALQQINGALGFTFGGVLDPGASGGNVPQGYDLQNDGNIEVIVQVGVEPRSWDAVKQLYRGR